MYKICITIGWFLLTLTLFSCNKDQITPVGGTEILGENNNVSFLIYLTDENNLPVKDARLILKTINKYFAFDKNGVVVIENTKIPVTGALAVIDAPDFHTQYKMLEGRDNSQNVVHVRMVSNNETVIINTGSEGALKGGGKLKLPDQLITAEGHVYSGPVHVKNHFFNPGKPDFLLSAPGNLLALNENNKLVTLGSLGMYRIELLDDIGHPLKMKNGDKAVLTFPILDKFKNKVQNSVPLWSFGENTGLWKYEGIASVQDNFATAEVSHFSFWNIDLDFEFANICFTAKASDGSNISGINLQFFVRDNIQTDEGITDNEGKVCSNIPTGENIVVQAYADGVLLQEFSVGPFSAGGFNIDLTIQRNIPEIKGRALSCDLTPVNAGYGFIYSSTNAAHYRYFLVGDDGKFSSRNFQYDQIILLNESDKRTIQLTLTESQMANNTDLGDIVICDNNPVATISGYVLIDTDEDGKGDKPVKNYKVFCGPFNPGGTYLSTYTNENGFYVFKAPPGPYNIVINEYVEGYTFIGSRDMSLDENDPNTNGLKPIIYIIINTDTEKEYGNNNFIFSLSQPGKIGGYVWFDVNGDGIADRPADGMELKFSNEYEKGEITTLITDINGRFESGKTITPFQGLIYLPASPHYNFLSDYDVTPDPDGDDRSLGANGLIPIRLRANEADDNNEFLISINKSRIIVRIMEDSNNDGTGDSPVANQRVELWGRNSSGVPSGPRIDAANSDEDGYIRFWADPGEHVLYFIGLSDYIAINNTDSVPDNNPVNMTGNPIFLPVNISGNKEYDDGNTFIVKKR